MKFACFITLVSSLIVPAWGQQKTTLVLTKEDALVRALERNLGIKIERSLVEISKEGIAFEKGAFDPEVTASYTTTSIDDRDAESLSAGVSGLVSTGGVYSVDIISDESFGEDGGYVSFAGVSFRQPLLRNFGFTANLTALRIARYQFDLSEWEYKQVLLDTLTATTFAFNGLYEAQETFLIAVRSRDLAQQLVDDNRKRVNLGVIARLDQVEAEAQLASRIERVLAASNTVMRAETQLKQLIFDDAGEALSFDLEAQSYMEPATEPDFQLYLKTLLENSPAYHIGEIALEIARLRLGFDQNQTLPSLDFIARYGFSGSGATLGKSLDAAFSDRDDSFTLGAAFRFPILNRTARAQEAVSKQRARIAEVDLQSVKQAIRLEFHASYQIMQTNFQRMEATRRARVLAEQSLEAEEKKFNAGSSSTFFVLRLQTDLSQAELREIAAIANYNRSVAEFNRLRGVLE